MTVGDNAVIGTNTVVTKDVPANAVAGGTPARVLRMREAPETLRWQLSQSAWTCCEQAGHGARPRCR